MRTLMTVALCLAATVAAADSYLIQRPFEVAGYTGFADGPGYAKREPQVGVAVSMGPSWLRGNVGGSYGWLHKAGTSGGYQRSASYSIEPGYHNAFVFAGISRNFTDQTEYTKTVDYRFVGGGYRWTTCWDEDRALSINEVRFTYHREHYSSYANRTEMYSASYSWDRKLHGALYLRVSLRLGAMYYDDNPYPGAKRRNGLASVLNIGFVGRP
jgi:hypothetical protein